MIRLPFLPPRMIGNDYTIEYDPDTDPSRIWIQFFGNNPTDEYFLSDLDLAVRIPTVPAVTSEDQLDPTMFLDIVQLATLEFRFLGVTYTLSFFNTGTVAEITVSDTGGPVGLILVPNDSGVVLASNEGFRYFNQYQTALNVLWLYLVAHGVPQKAIYSAFTRELTVLIQ